MWIPLPGPFAITSGRRHHSTETIGGGTHGLLWWPRLPVSPGFFAAMWWVSIVGLAVSWNLLVIVGFLLYLPFRPLHRKHIAARALAAHSG